MGRIFTWNIKRQDRLNELELKHPALLTVKEEKELAKLRWLKEEALKNG